MNDIITNSIAITALVISAVNMIRNRNITEKQTALAKRQLELEGKSAELAEKQLEMIETEEASKSRAVLHAEFERSGDSYHLVVQNIGDGIARNVGVELIDYDDFPFLDDVQLSWKELLSGKSIRTLACIHTGSDEHYKIRLNWDDDSGISKSKEHRLT